MFLQRRNCYEPWLVKFRVVQLQIMETQKQMLFFAQLTIITFSSGLWSFSCTSEAITTFRNKLISWLLLVAIVLQLSDYFMKKQIIHKSFHAGLMIINWSEIERNKTWHHEFNNFLENGSFNWRITVARWRNERI